MNNFDVWLYCFIILDLVKSAKADGGYPDSDDDSDDSGAFTVEYLLIYLMK